MNYWMLLIMNLVPVEIIVHNTVVPGKYTVVLQQYERNRYLYEVFQLSLGSSSHSNW